MISLPFSGQKDFVCKKNPATSILSSLSSRDSTLTLNCSDLDICYEKSNYAVIYIYNYLATMNILPTEQLDN